MGPSTLRCRVCVLGSILCLERTPFLFGRGVLQWAATTRSFPGRAAVQGQHRSQLLGSGRNGCTANSTRLPRPAFLEHVPCFMYRVNQRSALQLRQAPLLLGEHADVLHDDFSSMSLRGPKTLHDTGMRQLSTEAPRYCMTLPCFMYRVNQRSALQLRHPPLLHGGLGFRVSGMRQLSMHCLFANFTVTGTECNKWQAR